MKIILTKKNIQFFQITLTSLGAKSNELIESSLGKRREKMLAKFRYALRIFVCRKHGGTKKSFVKESSIPRGAELVDTVDKQENTIIRKSIII